MYLNPIIAIVRNLATRTFHPILFDERPFPGVVTAAIEEVLGQPTEPPKPKIQRHKSRCHHTTGFATREEAVAYINDEMVPTFEGSKLALVETDDFEWDGVGVPAFVAFFIDEPEDAGGRTRLSAWQIV